MPATGYSSTVPLMTAYSGESLDVNVGEVNFHYHDLFNQFADSAPDTVDEADFELYREIWKATILVMRERDMGQTWEAALVDYPNTKRLLDDDGVFWIIDRDNTTAQASEELPVAEEKIKPRVWLAQNGFLPKEQSGQIYDAQPDVVLAKGDTAFDLFFYLKLCNTRPLRIDQFLSHQLITNFGDDLEVFRRYITLNTAENAWLPPVPSVIGTATDTWFEALKTTINTNQSTYESGVKWTGPKVYLIKLIYALYYAGLLNDGKGSLIDLCTAVTGFFGVKFLPNDNALSISLSRAKKNGYSSDDFIKLIEEGFGRYLQSLAARKDKK